MYSNSSSSKWGYRGFVIAALIVLLGINIANLVITDEVEQAVCEYKTSAKCWTGNACVAPLKKRICPIRPGDDSNNNLIGNESCDSPDYVCDNTNFYPDGTCCNRHDFCYLDDPTKSCQQGVCVSQNATLCRGFCAVDTDCTVNASAPFPFFPTVETDIFCLNGACVAQAQAINPVQSPDDLLNLSTQDQRNISACLESFCFPVNISGPPAQICQYAWVCSQLTGYSDEVRKREFYQSGGDATGGGGDNDTITRAPPSTNAPIRHNYRLPGGGRYSGDQYRQANQQLNNHLDSLLRRQPSQTQ